MRKRRNITKRAMAQILSSCRICGLYNKPTDWICRKYTWQELKDLYDDIETAMSEYYNN